MVSVTKADEPPGVDTLELVVDELLDSPFQPLSLLAVLLLYWFDLSFSCFFSRRGTEANSLASSTSFLLYGSQFAAMRLLLLNPPSKHCRL